MKTVIIVYKSDNFHSLASRDVIGIATNEREAMKIIKKEMEEDGEKLTDDCEHQLHSMQQTQGYSGDGEFSFTEFNVNQLIK